MKKPTLAICYDFDKTLTPDDMQAQGFIQALGYDVSEFWGECNALGTTHEMDQVSAYMYWMIHKARGKVLVTKETLKEFGTKVELFPGVKDWFERINKYGELQGVHVEHYIISSGLKEMIEGCEIARYFKKIYSSSFYYDDAGVAVWPAQVVNYTNKTQFLFRIQKGTLDINDGNVNSHFKDHEYAVPFRNMVYIGDSDTDVPCMKLVNEHDGHSIGVYNPITKDTKKVHRMMEEHRIKYFTPADYSEDSEMDILIKSVINKTKEYEILEKIHQKCKEKALK